MKKSNKLPEENSEELFLKNKAKRKKASKIFNPPQQVKPRKKSKKAKKDNKYLKIFGIVFACILGAVVLAALTAGIYYFALGDKVDYISGFISGDSNLDGRKTSSTEQIGHKEDSIDIGDFEYYTFLATATDNSGNLTDVIMVARFHYVDEPSVSVLQIPRDTYVKVSSQLHFNEDGTLSEKNFDPKSGTYATKINTVFNHGRKLASSYIDELLNDAKGKKLKEIENLCKQKKYKFLNADPSKVLKYVNSSNNEVKQTVKNNIRTDFGITYLSTLIYHYFGIPVDYQAQVSINGFRGIVDAIGGVELVVPRDMDYDDEWQDLHIHLKKGKQVLDGKKAEEFVRFRRYVRGDVDRLDAQKLFINAFLDKLLSPSTVTKIDNILEEIQDNLYSSVSFNDMLRFSKKLLKMDMSTDIVLETLPGVGEYVGNASYFIAYRNDAIKLINEKFNVFDTNIEDGKFKMIDFNDVISKEKPAISESMVAVQTTTKGEQEIITDENIPEDIISPDGTLIDEALSDELTSPDEFAQDGTLIENQEATDEDASETTDITVTDENEMTNQDAFEDITDAEQLPFEEEFSDEASSFEDVEDDLQSEYEDVFQNTPAQDITEEETSLEDAATEGDTSSAQDTSSEQNASFTETQTAQQENADEESTDFQDAVSTEDFAQDAAA